MSISIVRTALIFLLLIAAMRVMGKRQLGELEPVELVVAVLISNLAAQPLQDPGIPLLYGVVPVLTLLVCQVLASGIAVKNARVRQLLCGRPSILIDNGRIVQREMRRSRITVDELFTELRGKDVTDIKTVRHAILETNGTLSVLLYDADAPATPRAMGLTVPEPGLPVSVVSEGRVLSRNLALLKRDRAWLQRELRARGFESPRQVYLMTVDGEGSVAIVERERGR